MLQQPEIARVDGILDRQRGGFVHRGGLFRVHRELRYATGDGFTGGLPPPSAMLGSPALARSARLTSSSFFRAENRRNIEASTRGRAPRDLDFVQSWVSEKPGPSKWTSPTLCPITFSNPCIWRISVSIRPYGGGATRAPSVPGPDRFRTRSAGDSGLGTCVRDGAGRLPARQTGAGV